jgi:hypothetical protein
MGPRILALVVACALSLAAAPAKTPKNVFAFRIAPPVRSDNVEVRYLLTGKFGIYSGWSVTRNPDSIWVVTERREGPATALKAVVFAPSCQPERVVVEDLRASSREHDFQCRPAPQAAVHGKFARPPEWKTLRVQVQVEYIAPWVNQFLGIAEDPAAAIHAAEALADSSGQFQMALPAFAIEGTAPDGAFTFVLREATSGNVLGALLPPPSLVGPLGLKAVDQYPREIEFGLQRTR